MRSEKSPRNWKLVVALAAATGLVTWSVQAFVVSCEEQLAEAYPPELKADLSACDAGERTLTAESDVSGGRFATALTGTWQLRSRTAHGITLNDETRSAALYAKVEARGDQLSGNLLLLDHPVGQDVLQASDSIAAHWGLSGSVKGQRAVVLAMDGSAIGSYAPVRTVDRAGLEFQKYRGVFVADGDASQWDRVVLMEGSLTFVSCGEGLVERYLKVSDEEPTVGGASIESYWQDLRRRSAVAEAPAPSAVDVIAAR